MESRKRKLKEGEGEHEEKKKETKAVDPDELYRFIQKYDGTLRTKNFHFIHLYVVAARGRDDYVRYLVEEAKVDVNHMYLKDVTALMFAVRNKHLSTARLLLELGARVDFIDMSGKNALFMAMEREDRPMIRLLIDHGAEMPRAEPDTYDVGRCWDEIVDFAFDLFMERLFSKVVTGGICSEGQFRVFLAEGVCDARLLIHVASFAYNAVSC